MKLFNIIDIQLLKPQVWVQAYPKIRGLINLGWIILCFMLWSLIDKNYFSFVRMRKGKDYYTELQSGSTVSF